MDRRRFLHLAAGCLAGTAAGCAMPGRRGDLDSSRPPDILLITADDMNWDTPGCYGGSAPDITPNIDRLASEGMLFEQAHVTISVSMPSRQVLMTGRYPHRYGSQGFNSIDRRVPTLQERLHAAGYLNGILGKVVHLLPERKFHWDFRQDFYELNCGRDPRRYYTFAKEFFDRANRARRPFFLMANSHDPHRPFALSEEEKDAYEQEWREQRIDLRGVPDPSRVYRPEEVSTPGFLPDLPRVRTDVANYHNSVRRCDDTVGAVLRALRESGRESNTLVMFLSDNGMDFPFAKANCYLHSTRTPWIVRWPGRVAPGSINNSHFISGIDYMPTILEAAGLSGIDGMDGRSFLPLLRGEEQEGRDRVFTLFNETIHERLLPMRCVQDACWGYIFNAWADSVTRYAGGSAANATARAMHRAARTDQAVRQRMNFLLYRTPEELYFFDGDPDALDNLATLEEYAQRLKTMRGWMLEWMENTGDPLLEIYRGYLLEVDSHQSSLP